MALGLFGLIGVGIILFYGHKLKNQIDEIRPEVDAVMNWTNASNALWKALEEFNQGRISVPQVVEIELGQAIKPRSPSQILIVPPSPSPGATATATPKASPSPKPKSVKKTKRKRETPTPKPIFNWFKHKP